MDFNIWRFILDTLEAAGVIGGYVSLSHYRRELDLHMRHKESYPKYKQVGPSGFHPIIGALIGIDTWAAGQRLWFLRCIKIIRYRLVVYSLHLLLR